MKKDCVRDILLFRINKNCVNIKNKIKVVKFKEDLFVFKIYFYIFYNLFYDYKILSCSCIYFGSFF